MNIDPGLCGRCAFVKELRSSRGSVFFMCSLADTRPELPRYPRLPVMECAEFRPNKSNAQKDLKN